MFNASPIEARTSRRYAAFAVWASIGILGVPVLYYFELISIETVNMLGRYMAFAIVAIGLDLVWGYTGMLCLCQAFFFALGGYAMGMYLAHHGGPEGIIDATGWKMPACLYVVYPHGVGEAPEDALVPWFWKPFYTLPVTVVLGMLIPGSVAAVIGYFVFKSRVRGVFFAILTQAITFAAWLVFCMNNMKLCGTNGLTNFDQIAGFKLSESGVKLALYVVTVLALVGVYLLCRLIVSSRLGRILIAIRDNENRLRFSGFKPYHYKVLVFALSAGIAGLGGVLYAPQMGIFTPSDMGVVNSIGVVIWVAVGGRGTLSGAVVGALAVNLFYNFLTSRTPALWPFIQGALFIFVPLLLPNGLMSLWHSSSTLLRRRLSRRLEDTVDSLTDSVQPVTEGEGGDGTSRNGIQTLLSHVSMLQTDRPEALLGGDLLRVENVQVVFDGFKALDVDSFRLGHRDLRVIIGPNGAGKTTLCDVISGKTRPTSGKVFFGDTEITSMDEVDIARFGIGRKFQTPTVFDSLTVYENMQLALPGAQGLLKSFRRRDTSDDRDRILSILERVHLFESSKKHVRYLSHGQRQWLEISMLLLAGPMVLLVDEPAAGLTDEETALTAELLLETQTEHSVIVIEHDMSFVQLLKSQVTVLNEGKIMAQGTMEELQTNEKVVAAYLGR